MLIDVSFGDGCILASCLQAMLVSEQEDAWFFCLNRCMFFKLMHVSVNYRKSDTWSSNGCMYLRTIVSHAFRSLWCVKLSM